MDRNLQYLHARALLAARMYWKHRGGPGHSLAKAAFDLAKEDFFAAFRTGMIGA